MRSSSRFLAAAAVLLAACGDSPSESGRPLPAAVNAVAGTPASAPAGSRTR